MELDMLFQPNTI